MKLSELYAKIQAAGDVHAYSAYLATPDVDGVDVDLATVGRVELQPDEGEARLYPASTSTEVDSVEPEPFLGMVLAELPLDLSNGNDLRLMVEMPLIRDLSGNDRTSFVEISDLYIGRESEEAWLLVRPISDFGAGLLPT
jgi:hypothetical protein